MKVPVFVIVAILIVIGCFSIATVKYHDHKITQQAAVNSAVQTANNTLKEHDAVASKAESNLTTQITTLNNQKIVLCNQVKTAKLTQALCN